MNATEAIKIRDPVVISKIQKMRIDGYSFKEIIDFLQNEYEIEVTTNYIKKMLETEATKMMYDSKDNLFIDKDKTIKDLVNRKAQNMEMIVDRLEELGELVKTIKVKIENWNVKLDEQIENYYEQHKDEGLDLETINQIKDSIHKDVNILMSLGNILSKQWEMYSDLYKMSNPEIKVDRLDMTFKFSNEIANIEKLGYFMVQAVDKGYIDTLKEAESQKKIRILKNITQ